MIRQTAEQLRNLRRSLRRAARKSRLLRWAYRRLYSGSQKIYLETVRSWKRLAGSGASRDDGARASDVNPGNMIWIFGSGRSGSTWLRSMMGEMDDHHVWEEPMVGSLFGEFYDRASEVNLGSADFVMGHSIRKGWVRAIRNFVLDVAEYSHPRLGGRDYLVVKEPNGSVGAPLLLEALPESRMIFLVRDPRDVISSVLDAAREGGWLHSQLKEEAKQYRLADRRPDVFVGRRATAYLKGVGNTRRAYETHRGPKTLVRYEDLAEDTLGTMKRIYSELGIPADGEELARSVEKHSWKNIPDQEKGLGKAYRKATPGGWKRDLTPKQIEMIEERTAPLLREFYPPS